MKSRHKDPARKRNKYKLGQFNNKEQLKAAFASKLFKVERKNDMRWKLEIVLSNGRTDDMYYETRQQAREAKKYYDSISNPDVIDLTGDPVVRRVKLVDLGK